MDDPNKSLSTFLIHNGLADPKWVTRFHEQNIIKQDQIIMGDEKMYKALSRGASFQEQAALKKIFKIVDDPVSPINDMEVYLVKAKLDPSYWSPIFAKQLGVTSAQAMQYVGGESYPTLQQFARKQMEKKNSSKDVKDRGGRKYFSCAT